VDIVPFIDLAAHHAPIRDDIRAAVDRVLTHGQYIFGPEVEAFEQDFAKMIGGKYGIGVSSGLDALRLALEAVGVHTDDEVIVPGNTFIATALAVSALGAVPVLVDCDPETYNIDVRLIRSVITKRTKAIVPVHLYGQAVEMDGIMVIAKEYGLHVIEDACQAHGARYKGRGCGTIGELGCFSFYPGKNLGGMGDGGLVTTNDEALAMAVRQRRAYGEAEKHHHVEKGLNARLDTIQAAIMGVKLPRLNASNAGRRRAARAYDRGLAGIPGVVAPKPPADETAHVYHLYVIRTPRRDQLQAFLNSKGIKTGIHYPIPIHMQPAYAELASSGSRLMVTTTIADEILSLPMFPELTDEQITRVCSAVAEFHGAR
jgi:dTDP-4-amino-4,6-dideoxygalactose transaminase